MSEKLNQPLSGNEMPRFGGIAEDHGKKVRLTADFLLVWTNMKEENW
ncbi:hypothetical protein OAL10_00870 [Gammaproteobacteria bacterium]|nr:hypothetical protein [Gammaproteobacteria bacterium]